MKILAVQGAVQINGNLQLYRGHAVWTNCTSFQNCTKNLPTTNDHDQHEIRIYLFLSKKAKVLPVTHRSSRQSFEVFCFFNRALTEGSDLALHPNEEMKMAKQGHGNVALFWPIFIFMYSRALQAFHDSLDIQNSEKRK